MRRIALLLVPLTLGGCAFNTWWNPPFTTGYNPNIPVGDSENLRRAEGYPAVSTPLAPEPGDIWPGPLPPTPTLQQLERESPMGALPELPVPGSPLSRGTAPSEAPTPPPQLAPGSSTPPESNQPPLMQPQIAPPRPGPSAPAAAPPPHGPSGQIYQTPSGPAVTNGGGPGYKTTTTPGGGSAIIVPNGNGTSTIIYSNGRIETVPTPH